MQHPQQVPNKKLLKIHDIAEALNIKKFVIKLWEKEFALDADQQNKGGQRLYSTHDLKVFQHIKELLHKQSMSIEEARLQIAQLYQVPPALAAVAAPAAEDVVAVATEEIVEIQAIAQPFVQEPIAPMPNTYSAASQTTLSAQEAHESADQQNDCSPLESQSVPIMEELSALVEDIQPAVISSCCANTKDILTGMQQVKEKLLTLKRQLTNEE